MIYILHEGCDLHSCTQRRIDASHGLAKLSHPKFGPPGRACRMMKPYSVDDAFERVADCRRICPPRASSTFAFPPQQILYVRKTRPQNLLAQAILTPNNAGMFRSLAPGYHRPGSKLGNNASIDEPDPDDDLGSGKNTHMLSRGAESPEKPHSGSIVGRRMTFGGLRSDKRGETYKTQRRPSFMANLGQRAVQAAAVATRATRRLSIHGKDGQGFELVAIAVSSKTRCVWQRRDFRCGDDALHGITYDARLINGKARLCQ